METPHKPANRPADGTLYGPDRTDPILNDQHNIGFLRIEGKSAKDLPIYRYQVGFVHWLEIGWTGIMRDIETRARMSYGWEAESA